MFWTGVSGFVGKYTQKGLRYTAIGDTLPGIKYAFLNLPRP